MAPPHLHVSRLRTDPTGSGEVPTDLCTGPLMKPRRLEDWVIGVQHFEFGSGKDLFSCTSTELGFSQCACVVQRHLHIHETRCSKKPISIRRCWSMWLLKRLFFVICYRWRFD